MIERKVAVTEMHGEAGVDRTYVALAAASCAIATFGLLENSAPVIIGAMLIAPLMTPIICVALAIVTGEFTMLRRALVALLAGTAIAVGLSMAIAAVVRLPTPGFEIVSRGHPNLLDLGIALSAGAIAGYARVRKGIAASVGGAAIAVALMPPLCVIGIGLSLRGWDLAYGAFLLFMTNFVGITLACALVFVAVGFAAKHARNGLLTTAGLLVVIAVPLAFATSRLLEEQRLEAALRNALLSDTQTFKRVQLVDTTFDWLSNPLRVVLVVRSQNPITSTQVRFLQAFTERRMGRRRVELRIEVSPVQTVVAGPTSGT